MIASLRGTVLVRETDGVLIVEVGGIGHRVEVTAQVLGKTMEGDEVLLYTHHHFPREQDQKLIGFLSREEVRTFQTLIATDGVGPKVAQAVLNMYPPAQLAAILDIDDVVALNQIPGVGKKTAQKILLELKNKLVLDLTEAEGGDPATRLNADIKADVEQGMLALGYGQKQVKEVLSKIEPAPGASASEVLKMALRSVGA